MERRRGPSGVMAAIAAALMQDMMRADMADSTITLPPDDDEPQEPRNRHERRAAKRRNRQRQRKQRA